MGGFGSLPTGQMVSLFYWSKEKNKMSETKRFYWLKLQEDFFEDDTIDFIESQENGERYCLFYLKLCLKALKSEGKLIRYVGNMLIPYDEKGLAKLTRTDVDTVRCALALFDKIGLVSRLDTGEIFINQLNEMVGTETDKAKLMRQKRAKEKLISNNVTPMLPECYTEIELEKEKEQEKEKETKKENPDYKKVIEQYFNNYKNLFEQKRLNTEKPYFTQRSGKAIKDILTRLSLDNVITILNNAMSDNWIVENGYAITTILAESQINKLLNGKNTTSQNKGFNKESLKDKDFFNM